ncbi:MAG: ABC transporter permease [Gemmatimonadota bacterium]
MNASSLNPALPGTVGPRRNVFRMYLMEIKFELLKTIRLPAYVVPTLLFPVMFYVLFGLTMNRGDHQADAATYLIATYGAFGVIGASFVGFGIGVATERGQGWLLLKRASPMPPMAYFAAKIVMSMLFSLILIIILVTLGTLFGHVRIPVTTVLLLAGILVAGSLPFCAMGLALGYLAGPNSAPAIVNLVYLPMSFVSGLWIPMEMLPSFIKHIAPFLPAYHFAQLALGSIGASSGGSVIGHVLALLGFAIGFLALALRAYRNDEGKLYG